MLTNLPIGTKLLKIHEFACYNTAYCQRKISNTHPRGGQHNCTNNACQQARASGCTHLHAKHNGNDVVLANDADMEHVNCGFKVKLTKAM